MTIKLKKYFIALATGKLTPVTTDEYDFVNEFKYDFDRAKTTDQAKAVFQKFIRDSRLIVMYEIRSKITTDWLSNLYELLEPFAEWLDED